LIQKAARGCIDDTLKNFFEVVNCEKDEKKMKDNTHRFETGRFREDFFDPGGEKLEPRYLSRI